MSLRLPRGPLGLLGLLLLGACSAVGPEYTAPEMTLPEGWRDAEVAHFVAETPDELPWWSDFDDPVLTGLIDRVFLANHDLRMAGQRVLAARALRLGADAARRPTIDAFGTWARRGESKNTAFGPFNPDSEQATVQLEAAWEPDLFGRVQRNIEAATADLDALEADARHLAVLLAAETATAYVEHRAFGQRLAIARKNEGLQQQTLEVVTARFESGLVSERDVAQAATNLATTRSRIPLLEAGQRAADNRLHVLVGAVPGSIEGFLDDAGGLLVPPERIVVGLPNDLLRRRPDVRQAERAYAAAVARIGVATADLFPRLTLNGNIGFSAQDFGDFSREGSGVFSFGPSLRWNLFDGGRTRAEIAAAEARAEEARLAWEQSVLQAVEEAENARSAFLRERERHQALVRAATEAERAAAFARTQYQEGLADFQTVLDSERTLADLEDERTLSGAEVVTNLVALYRALGGL